MKKFVLFILLSVFAICVMAVSVQTESEVNNATNSSETYVCKKCDGSGIDPIVTRNCSRCNGKKKLSELTYCNHCNGKGTIVDKYGDTVTCTSCGGRKAFYREYVCPDCGGSGSEKMTCMSCRGKGTVDR